MVLLPEHQRGDPASWIRDVQRAAVFVESNEARVTINRNAGTSPSTFGVHACTLALFYLGWEFFFRGFMQCGLRDKLGTVNALGVQVIASTLLHLGTPWVENFAAIAGGILWGILVFLTRSLLSGLVQHFLLGLSLVYFICYM